MLVEERIKLVNSKINQSRLKVHSVVFPIEKNFWRDRRDQFFLSFGM